MHKFRKQKYFACQLIAAINARIFLGGDDIPEALFEELVDLTCGRVGACIGVEKAYPVLGLEYTDGPVDCGWIEQHTPIELTVNDPKHGNHAILITSTNCEGLQYGYVFDIVNGSERQLEGSELAERLPHWDNNRRCRSFSLKND